MIKIDTHMHTSISSDSDTPMKDMVLESINKGLTDIYFTEHMDYEFPDQYTLPFVFDPDEYFNTVNECRSLYNDKINIHYGIEIGLKDTLKKGYKELLSSYPWDYVIGSTHIVDELDPYYKPYWEMRGDLKGVKDYFDQTYRNIRSCCCFDSIGHLDYILRYIPGSVRTHSNTELLAECNELIENILSYIIENNIALEINASGYRTGLNTTNPDEYIIRKYMNMGGKLFTIGSDAHSTEYVALKFDLVEKMMKKCCITEYISFVNRKPVIHKF